MSASRRHIAFEVDASGTRFGQVEVRVLVDGEPVVEQLFDAGPTESPDKLFGLLGATDEPRTVRLAEAECTEGCCGGLYVTIQRIGDEVVWSGWHNSNLVKRPLRDEDRFAAAQYDEALARASRDRGWEWPAARLARLLRARFQADPSAFGRWDCRFAGAYAAPRDRDHVRVSYDRIGYMLQFAAVFPVTAGEPDAQVDAIVRALTDEDPRQQRWLAAGTPESIERFGFTTPSRVRRR